MEHVVIFVCVYKCSCKQCYVTAILTTQFFLNIIIVFTVVPCILMLLSLLFVQLNAQLDCSKGMLKLTLKFILKFLLHVSVIQPSSGSLMFVLC